MFVNYLLTAFGKLIIHQTLVFENQVTQSRDKNYGANPEKSVTGLNPFFN